MLIRPFCTADMSVARDLLRQLGYEVAAAELGARMERVLAAADHYTAVAEDGGQVVGLLHMFERPALEKPCEAVVQAIVVDAKMRGRGIGKALMDKGSRLGCPVDPECCGLLHSPWLRQGGDVGPDAQGTMRDQGKFMIVRRDHVGGGAFIVVGALVLAVSGDLPFGTLASPGAGMLPKLVIGLMMAFGAILLLRAGESPPFAAVAWGDFPHALRVIAVTAAGATVYTWLGFLVTMSLLLFGLTFVIERKPILSAAAFSAGVTGLAYTIFGTLLKSPLPRGLFGF
jgi:GNAT superfamily N-acetyltransferase